jgi:hypothetical protein
VGFGVAARDGPALDQQRLDTGAVQDRANALDCPLVPYFLEREEARGLVQIMRGWSRAEGRRALDSPPREGGRARTAQDRRDTLEHGGR